MSCALTLVREHEDAVFDAIASTEVRLMVRGSTPQVSAAIVAASYQGTDVPVADAGVKFSILRDLNTLNLIVDSNPPRSTVEICEVCIADPLRVNVLDRFFTSEPPEIRGLDIRGT
jgi:hypothetical protein